MIGNEEGEMCNRDGCTGTMQYKIDGCTCHINPPCSACVNVRSMLRRMSNGVNRDHSLGLCDDNVGWVNRAAAQEIIGVVDDGGRGTMLHL